MHHFTELARELSLAQINNKPKEFTRFQALERYGLEEFARVAAEIISQERSGTVRSLAYLKRKKLTLNICGLDHIPRHGPVVIAANHRLGALDGVIVDAMLEGIRQDRMFLALKYFAALGPGRIIEVDLPSGVKTVRTREQNNAMKAALGKISDALLNDHCICVFPGAGQTVFDPHTGVQSDKPYIAFSHLLRALKHTGVQVIPVYIDCQFSMPLFHAFDTDEQEFFALQWAEINRIEDQDIPVHIGPPLETGMGNSLADAERVHQAIHALSGVRNTPYPINP